MAASVGQGEEEGKEEEDGEEEQGGSDSLEEKVSLAGPAVLRSSE